MISCQRDFTLTVNPVAGVVAYWNMDALGPGGVAEDSNANYDLIPGVGPATVVPGQISDAFQMGHLLQYLSADPALYPPINGSFTLRFWFKIDAFAIGHTLFVLQDTPATDTNFRISYSTTAGGRFSVFVSTPTNTYSFTIGAGLADGLWHRFVVVYESGVSIRARIDNGADTVVAASGLWTQAPASITFDLLGVSDLSGTFDRMTWDEVYWSNTLAWTAAQITYDWNGGAGRTWPDVPV